MSAHAVVQVYRGVAGKEHGGREFAELAEYRSKSEWSWL